MAEGIERRRGKKGVGYRAVVYAGDGKQLRKTFPTLAAAKGWRQDTLKALRAGTLRLDAAASPTVREAADTWIAGAEAGQIRNRSGDPFKPSAVRTYEYNLRLRVLPEFGDRRLADVQRVELQQFIDQLVAAGASPATVMTTLLPLRAIYRRVLSRGQVKDNPTRGLEMPAIRRRIRYVHDPEMAAKLLDALDGEDRTLWATALYAGLRRGELVALRWQDVDLAQGVLRVRKGWDAVEGEIAPKSREGRRNVPIPAPLRDLLLEHRMGSAIQDTASDAMSAGTGRVFRSDGWVRGAVDRARNRWRGLGLEPMTLHEARHTYASLMIAAGVNAKALATFMGHANIAITYDLYGHLMPGSEAEAAGRLEALLARAVDAADVPISVPKDPANPVVEPDHS